MKPPDPPPATAKTPLEKMTELTRRLVAVRKTELLKGKKKKPKR